MCVQDGINKDGIKTVMMCFTAGQIKINIYINSSRTSEADI